jgi:type IV pilus assembly protein PilC
MLLEPHLSNKALAEFCHRLAVETEAGIDIRRSWQREAESARGRMQPAVADVRDAVAKGETLSAALARTGKSFPPLFLEMVEVGEESGTLGQVFHRLAAHYRRQTKMERVFLAGIAWPMLQLVAAIVVIGILILVMGIIPARGGERIDPLGFGLIGVPGFIVYCVFIFLLALGVGAVVVAMRRGVLWTRPLQRALMKTPGLGSALERIALARLAWALHLTLNSAMDLRRVVPLALRATGSDYYMKHTDELVADVARGDSLHVAFSRTGAFPSDFIDALGVAEESGRIVESMDRLSKRYEEESEAALQALTVLAGFVVWALVAGVIVFLIFRLAGFYFNTINEALEMTR